MGPRHLRRSSRRTLGGARPSKPSSSARARRRRRRGDLGCRRPGPRRPQRRRRRRGGPRRALVPDHRTTPRLALLLKSGNFGTEDLLVRAMRGADRDRATRRRAAATQIVELGASLFTRTLTFGRTGNLSVRTGRQRSWSRRPASASGASTPTQLSVIDLAGQPRRRGQAVQGGVPARGRLPGPTRRRRGRPPAQHPRRRRLLPGRRRPDDVLPPLTAYYVMRVGRLPLLPYHAPGDDSLEPLAETDRRRPPRVPAGQPRPRRRGADLASAADAVEELEETARLFLLLRGHADPTPDRPTRSRTCDRRYPS